MLIPCEISSAPSLLNQAPGTGAVDTALKIGTSVGVEEGAQAAGGGRRCPWRRRAWGVRLGLTRLPWVRSHCRSREWWDSAAGPLRFARVGDSDDSGESEMRLQRLPTRAWHSRNVA